MNTVLNNEDFRNMKQVDRQYGEQTKSAKTAPKKVKEKHRQNFTRMSLAQIAAMEDSDMAEDILEDSDH